MFSRHLWLLPEVTLLRALPNTRNPVAPLVRRQFKNDFHNRRTEFRERINKSLGPEDVPIHASGPLYISNLIKPLIFSLGVSATAFTACVIWQYEEHRQHARTFLKGQINWFHGKKTKQEKNVVTKWWDSLRDSDKVYYPILLANVLVFAAWRVKAWQPVLMKYFCSNPSSSALCSPMLFSTFSHYSMLHITANMYVLYSFMPPAVQSLGKEQFVAMYLSAGVLSSLASYAYKVIASSPGLSLGASGAIMAVLAYVCVAYPETKLSIIFLPMYTFDAGTAIKFVVGLDLLGVMLGWRFFDHAAHLGGAVFGMFWYYWGSKHIWGNREPIMQYWHAMREAITSR